MASLGLQILSQPALPRAIHPARRVGLMELLKPGQIFAQRYRIERFLAQGGMGAVFVALQLATDQAVALKVIRPGILSSPSALKQFELEANVAGRARSENIVRVMDAGHDAETGLPFLSMELLEGETLEALVARAGPLPATEVIEYLGQTARGLDKAHRYVGPDGTLQPIVHRDLKPENLFRTRRDTGEALIKILDFGLAKTLKATSNVSQDVRGTPLYMAREQAAGEAISPQTDIWSFGLIAFFLLTGRCFWKAGSNPEAGLPALLLEILREPKPAASERSVALIGKSLGKGFDLWLGRCLAPAPEQRFASAGEAVAALQAALGQAPSSGLTATIAESESIGFSSTLLAPRPSSTTDKLALSKTLPAATTRPKPHAWLLAPVALFALAVAGIWLAPRAEVGTVPKVMASAGRLQLPAPSPKASAAPAAPSASAVAPPSTASAAPLISSAHSANRAPPKVPPRSEPPPKGGQDADDRTPHGFLKTP